MSLLAVGTVAFDCIETPAGKADRIVGGAATYITLAASYLTSKINLVSVVGGDFPSEVLADLQKRNINLDGLQIKKDQKSFFWAGKYRNNMNERDTLETQLNVLADFDPILPSNYKTSDYLMLGNLQPEVQYRVIEQMTNRPKFIALDTMNFWINQSMESLKKVLKHIDALIINDEEARDLSNEYSLLKASKVLLSMGPSIVVIKKGEHGAFLFTQNNTFYAPALPLAEVFDPTGAGDTFAGGFTGYIARTKDLSFENLKRALIYGSAMASFCVEKFGIARLMELTPSEIDQRISEFVKLVHFEVTLPSLP
jgi:sugar/nucleoside kinase (ribokinase family)